MGLHRGLCKGYGVGEQPRRPTYGLSGNTRGVWVKGLSQDSPGAVQEGYKRKEKRKESPRGATGSRPPNGVPRATLRSCEG
ncbi:hypothetical protein NPIL_349371 [Nephila pilipes]|uniref:Uncharacterized protein n=1 Tax=Nephila pilipes TaxID=299642 RepID=A0A8X6NIQ0_NEPPI|nr:hypothetical protein NPIL_173051 [Nephila pilipes]GFT14955.1 hypothetical protein NPIL_349371 [Nephila pilipes]